MDIRSKNKSLRHGEPIGRGHPVGFIPRLPRRLTAPRNDDRGVSTCFEKETSNN